MRHEIAARTPERTYVLPHPALRPVISHYTIFRPRISFDEGAAGQLHLLPDASGCIVCAVDSSAIDLKYWGPTSKTVSVARGGGAPPLLMFVEFLPGGAARLLHMPLRQWQDRTAPLDCVDAGLHRSISEAFSFSCGSASSKDHGAFLRALNRIFLARLANDRTPPLAAHILSAVRAARGTARTDELARATGYSARHLNRVAADSIGLSLKLFSRVVRVNAACLALTAPEHSLTELAMRFEYHDQAHFIHDFTSICGVAPGKFRGAVSRFYNEELKLFGIIPRR